MLRADGRVVQAGGDGVGLFDLAVVVTHEVRAGAVQDADGALGDGGAVLALAEAFAAGFGADQFDAVVVNEIGEHADGVGAAADAGDHHVGQCAGALEDLGARLGGDDAVEFFDDLRERVRAGSRAKEVVGFVEGCGPVTKRLVHRVLQGARAGFHADDLRAHQAHAVHVRFLALHVGLAHVDHAVQAKQRTGKRGCSAVLAGAGLRDNAGLAHLLRQQRLTDHLVGLMGAAVYEVLAFEEDARVAVDGQVAAFSQRGWAAEVVAQEGAVFGHEGVVVKRVDEGLLELVECWQEGFGDELSAEFAVVRREESHGVSFSRGSCRWCRSRVAARPRLCGRWGLRSRSSGRGRRIRRAAHQ